MNVLYRAGALTGDTTNTGLYLGIALLAIVLLLILFFWKRRKKDEEND